MLEKDRVTGTAFGTLLRRHRLEAGLSQEALAERAQMSVVGIGALERGDRRYPYRATVRLLANALDLTPAATAQLETAAERPRRSRDRSDSEAAGGGHLALTNLPVARTSLIGREAEIADIVGMLQESPLVTITGAGGVGKTRTALAAGAALLEETKAGVWLVELAPVERESFVADAVARGLNIQESPNRTLLETLLADLKHKSLLLILDNCEHVIAQVAALADALLRGCPALRILATSREPLRIAGEQTRRLPSLRVPTLHESLGLTAAEAASYASMVLFFERAKAIDRGFTLSDDTAPTIAEICRRLDGIPLAIELAAARVNVLPPRMLLTKLDQRLRVLTSGDRIAPPRQQTMRALIDWSYALLSRPEQRLFERLSVFAGGCTLEAAAAIYAGDAVDEFGSLDLLELLVDKSLVVADVSGPEPRYELLESSRQYAHEKLSVRGEAAPVARRHALVYLELAEHFEREWKVAPETFSRILPQAKVELANWRTALDWAINSGGDVVLGQRIAGTLRCVWAELTLSEGRRWLRLALDLVDPGTPLDLVAQIESAETELALRSGELQAALDSVDRALLIYNELGDLRGVTTSLGLAGLLRSRLGRSEEAEPLLWQAMESARTLGDRKVIGQILRCTAHARSVVGHLDDAHALYAQALAIFTELGAAREAAAIAVDLAEAEFRGGNAHSAVRLAGDALASLHMDQRTYPHISVALRHNMAAYLVTLARFDEARAYAREALDLARELQVVAVIFWTLQHLAAVAALRPSATEECKLQDQLNAARLLGFIVERFAALGTPQEYTEQQEFDKVSAALRGRFDSSELAQLMAEGAAMSEELAIELALSI